MEEAQQVLARQARAVAMQNIIDRGDATTMEEAQRVLSHVFRQLNAHDVTLEAMLLKPSMVLPGLDAVICENDQEEVARLTTQTMMRAVPPAVPGIHFLSGGMGAEEATQNLQLLQVLRRLLGAHAAREEVHPRNRGRDGPLEHLAKYQ